MQHIAKCRCDKDEVDAASVIQTSMPCFQQVCSICGITQTPVWRRLNKALVCNACGLKRRRSANIGRQGNNSQKKNEDAQTAREGVSGDKATYEQCAKLEGA